MVAVGDSAEVELIFTSSAGGYGGEIRKNATVTCNDNERGSFNLQLASKVYNSPDSLKPFTLSSATIKFDEQTKAKELSVVVRNESKQSVKMQLVSYARDYLKVDLPSGEVKPGKEKEIKVKLLPGFTEPELKKSFTFACNDSAKTRYTIPVVYSLKPASLPVQKQPITDVKTKAPVPAADTTKVPVKSH